MKNKKYNDLYEKYINIILFIMTQKINKNFSKFLLI